MISTALTVGTGQLPPPSPQVGYLMLKWTKKSLPLEIRQSGAGHFIGTFDADSLGGSRESVEYFPSSVLAQHALATGQWTQLREP